MANESVERQYLDRNEVLNVLEEFSESRYDQPKASPSYTADQLEKIIKKLRVRGVGDGVREFGEIHTTFRGINLTMGNCNRCGKKLVWYTTEPFNRCPYCGMRRKINVQKLLNQEKK